MGFRYRKSVKMGPFRMTFSKSGVSYSVGVKGARITKRADGKIQKTLSIPGTGISHVTTETPSSQNKNLEASSQSREEIRAQAAKDYYDMETKKQGCGCALVLGLVFLAVVVLFLML